MNRGNFPQGFNMSDLSFMSYYVIRLSEHIFFSLSHSSTSIILTTILIKGGERENKVSFTRLKSRTWSHASIHNNTLGRNGS